MPDYGPGVEAMQWVACGLFGPVIFLRCVQWALVKFGVQL